jgi:hypothetical protein
MTRHGVVREYPQNLSHWQREIFAEMRVERIRMSIIGETPAKCFAIGITAAGAFVLANEPLTGRLRGLTEYSTQRDREDHADDRESVSEIPDGAALMAAAGAAFPASLANCLYASSAWLAHITEGPAPM